MRLTVQGSEPQLGPDCFIAPGACLVGEVSAGSSCSFWFNTVIRGDVAAIFIGDNVNIQDGSIIHGTYKRFPVKIGNNVSVGHLALVHGCEVGDDCLIGMGAILMDNCKIGAGSVVAAGTLVPGGKEFPENSLIMGRPGVLKRKVSDSERALIADTAKHYLMYKDWYKDCEVKND